MSIRGFAGVYGVVFLLAALAGLVPGLSPVHQHPDLVVTAGARRALGLFPVNILHDLVHALFGVWGLLAARTVEAARLYARVVAILYALLALMGLLPPLDSGFGLIPIYGNDIWLHLLLAAGAAYIGFLHRDGHGPTDTLKPARRD